MPVWQSEPRPDHITMIINKTLLLLLIAVLSGCATISRHNLDQRYGPAEPQRFDMPRAPTGGLSYRADVQPIVERRCVVCHACYDAPCQLKLGAWEGIARGASDELVYDGGRLSEAAPSRLFVDAGKASEWRQQGFFPVLNERGQTPAANLAASVFYRALQLKHSHPLPETAVLPATFDFSLDRAQQCPRIEEYDAFATANPLWGMPFGLPGLSDAEFATLRNWLQQGAPLEALPPLPAAVERQVAEWERFFNGGSRKERLVSRYIYEHLFLAHLYFDSDPQHHFFRLVRSRTPPGQAIEPIASRRPYDDPGGEDFHYRLERERESIVDKTHMPYALGERDLPVRARYQFMLDEAEFTIMGFIKGPVCRGQVALNVIQDRFWVFFLANDGSGQAADEFLERESRFLELPTAKGSDAGIIGPWREYAKKEEKYLQDKSAYLASRSSERGRPDLKWIWDGDGSNPNAALTVFRHFDSATVVKGLLGEVPKTGWVIGYPLLERIHYLLVAGFDVYGNVGHQLLSRLYMDFLRMEGEFNFLSFLPSEQRLAVRDYWYRGASDEVREHVYGSLARFDVDSGISFRSGDARREFFGMLQQRLAQVADRRYELAGVGDAALQADLALLAGVRGPALSWMPELVILRIEDGAHAARYLTLLRNTGHSNVSSLLREGRELLPEENTLSVARGFVGAYPNAIYRVQRPQIPELAHAIGQLGSEDDYRVLADRFAVRRSDPAFWQYSDELQATHLDLAPLTAGLLDYNRLENR